MRKIAPVLVFLVLLVAARPSIGATYRVKKGDTLDRIARRYGTSVRRIKRENGLSSSRLKPGRRLEIALNRHHRIKHHKIRNEIRRKSRLSRRRFSERKIARRKKLDRREIAARQTVRHEAAVSKAKVAGSDSLADARTLAAPKAGTLDGGKNTENPEAEGVRKAGAEDVSASASITPGDTPSKPLVPLIPGKTVPGSGLSNSISGAIVNSMIRESAREDKIVRADAAAWDYGKKDEYHRVKRGETLFSIARHYGTTVRQLRRLNRFRSGKTRIKPGERLVVRVAEVKKEVPGTYVVRRGDTFYKIAREFHLNAEDLVDINEMDPSELKPGVVIRLTDAEDESPSAKADLLISAPQIEAKIKEIEDSKTVQSLSIKDRLLLFAKTMMNIPYRFGGTSFYGIDCSAFVQKVFNLLDIPLPRTAREQYKEGVPVSLGDLSIGDLVFFRTYASFPSHVGIYIGQNLFIHASSGGHRVKIGNLKTPYFMKRIIGAKRLFFGQDNLPALPAVSAGQ